VLSDFAIPYLFRSAEPSNATLQAPPIAEARNERRLLAVACKRLLGAARVSRAALPPSRPHGSGYLHARKIYSDPVYALSWRFFVLDRSCREMAVVSSDLGASLMPVGVAVGMPVTRHPPHRSRRAALPHRAPASGRDAQALRRIRMQNVGFWKPLGGESIHPLPGHAMALTAPS